MYNPRELRKLPPMITSGIPNEPYWARFSHPKMAFISDSGVACHEWVTCKDKLQNFAYAHLCYKNYPDANPEYFKGSIGGSRYQAGTSPELSSQYLQTGIYLFRDPGFDRSISCAVSYLHQLEARRGFEFTKLIYGEKGKTPDSNVWVLQSPLSWMHHPVLMSFYFFNLRVGLSYPGTGDIEEHARSRRYLTEDDFRTTKSFDWRLWCAMLDHPLTSLFPEKSSVNWKPHHDREQFHYYSGFFSAASRAGCVSWNYPEMEDEPLPPNYVEKERCRSKQPVFVAEKE